MDDNKKPEDVKEQEIKDKKLKGISTKGKFASAFFILCLTTVMVSYQNCGMVATSSMSKIDFTDVNNCGVAQFDMQSLGLPGTVQIGVQYVASSPVAFISFPLPGAGGIMSANGSIDDIPGATWYTMPDPPTYQIEIPVDSVATLTYEERQNKLPSKIKSDGTHENKGPYLFGFDRQVADVKNLTLDQYNNLDGRLYYRNSRPQTLGLLVMSEDLPKLPLIQGFLQNITPSKTLEKCDQTIGHVAYIMVEDEDEDDQYQANNGIYLSIKLDNLVQ